MRLWSPLQGLIAGPDYWPSPPSNRSERSQLAPFHPHPIPLPPLQHSRTEPTAYHSLTLETVVDAVQHGFLSQTSSSSQPPLFGKCVPLRELLRSNLNLASSRESHRGHQPPAASIKRLSGRSVSLTLAAVCTRCRHPPPGAIALDSSGRLQFARHLQLRRRAKAHRSNRPRTAL